MPDITLILAGLFLPLFPLSMVFNALFDRMQHVALRCLLLLGWPQIGLAIIHSSDINVSSIPTWFITWALATSLLYAFRMLSLRAVGQWNSFLATSMWATLWLASSNTSPEMQQLYALGISAPLVLLAFLSAGLEKRFGAAYTGLYGGLAQSLPRFTGLLVFIVLAAIATPVFPGFFIMLKLIITSSAAMPLATLSLLVIWLLWSWAGVKLLQGLIVGTASQSEVTGVNALKDFNLITSWSYTLLLIMLIVSSAYLTGGLS